MGFFELLVEVLHCCTMKDEFFFVEIVRIYGVSEEELVFIEYNVVRFFDAGMVFEEMVRVDESGGYHKIAFFLLGW